MLCRMWWFSSALWCGKAEGNCSVLGSPWDALLWFWSQKSKGAESCRLWGPHRYSRAGARAAGAFGQPFIYKVTVYIWQVAMPIKAVCTVTGRVCLCGCVYEMCLWKCPLCFLIKWGFPFLRPHPVVKAFSQSSPLHKQFKLMELPGCTFWNNFPFILCWGHYWLVVTWWLGAFEDDYPVLLWCTPHSGFIHCFLKTRCSFAFGRKVTAAILCLIICPFLWCLRGSSSQLVPTWMRSNLAGKDRIRAAD